MAMIWYKYWFYIYEPSKKAQAESNLLFVPVGPSFQEKMAPSPDVALVSLKAYNLFVVTPILILNTVPVRRLVWLCFCKSIGSLYTNRAEGPC